MKSVAAALLVCTGLMTVSGTAEPPIQLDGSVRGLNPRVYGALVTIDRASGRTGILDAQAVQVLSQEILADQQIDAGETDLLVELTHDQARLIRITGDSASAGTVTWGTTFGAPRQVLRELLLPGQTLDKLMTTGAEGWQQVALLSERSPADAGDIQTHLQRHIASLWGQSALGNRYEPIRNFIKQADTDIKTLPVAAQTSSQSLLYEAFLQADGQVNGNIPDAFYHCLK